LLSEKRHRLRSAVRIQCALQATDAHAKQANAACQVHARKAFMHCTLDRLHVANRRWQREVARDRTEILEPQLQSDGAPAVGPPRKIVRDLTAQRRQVLVDCRAIADRVQVAFERETPPVVAPDVIIAVGAEASSLPPHIVRSGTTPSITRGSAGRWLTRQEALTEFGL